MTISRDDAAQALSDIASAQGRSHALAGYSAAGPILIVWGVVWLLGYAAMGVVPTAQWGLVWAPADLIGIVATILLSQRANRQAGVKGTTWRIIGGMVLIAVFCGALFSMVRTSDLHVYLAFPGLLTGTIYATIGLWRMTRYLWVGAAVIAASLLGFFAFPAILPY
jgi:hypothetical protein